MERLLEVGLDQQGLVTHAQALEAGVGVEYRRTSDGTLLVFHRRDAFDGVAHEGSRSYGEGIRRSDES